MKRQACSTILAGTAMLLFAATGALAQADQKHDAHKTAQHGMSKTDMASMMNEPHSALAMAYGQGIGTFARALRHQALGNGPLDVTFARAAVGEIRRSFDQMQAHHAEHEKMISGEMRSRMAEMMKEMETHRSMLNDAILALEKDVRADQLDARQVARDSESVLKHLDAMAKMHHGRKEKQTK